VEPAAGAFAAPMNRRCGLNGVKTGLKDRRRILSHGFKRFDIRVHIFSTFRPSVCNSLIPESKIRQSKRAGSVFEKTLLRYWMLDKYPDLQYLLNMINALRQVGRRTAFETPLNGLFEG